MQLAAREHGLSRLLASIAPSPRRTDDGMQLVDKQNDLARRILHFFQHRLEPLFNSPAELSQPAMSAPMSRVMTAISFNPPARPCEDPLRETFDDRGLAHAGSPMRTGLFLVGATAH